MNPIPNGAEKVIAVRRKGMKPSEMLIISTIGPVHEQNHVIHAKLGCEYDWRWIADLKVCVYANQKSILRPLISVLAREKPEWLGVYQADIFKGHTAYFLPKTDDIEKQKSQWRWELHYLHWTDYQNNQFAWGE